MTQAHTHTEKRLCSYIVENEKKKKSTNGLSLSLPGHHDLKFLENAFISIESISGTTVIIVLLSALWLDKTFFFWKSDG